MSSQYNPNTLTDAIVHLDLGDTRAVRNHYPSADYSRSGTPNNRGRQTQPKAYKSGKVTSAPYLLHDQVVRREAQRDLERSIRKEAEATAWREVISNLGLVQAVQNDVLATLNMYDLSKKPGGDLLYKEFGAVYNPCLLSEHQPLYFEEKRRVAHVDKVFAKL
jgi:hypothetical protein